MSTHAKADQSRLNLDAETPLDIAPPENNAEAPASETVAAPVAPAPMPVWKAVLYGLSATMISITQGLGLNLAFVNLTQVQGSLAATSTEAAWLAAAYMAPNVSMSIALVKIRTQFGLRRFAEVGIVVFVIASFLNLFVSDLHSALVVRFVSGMAAAPLSTLGFLYMLEAFPPDKRLSLGLGFALLNLQIPMPLARLVSPYLLDIGQWRELYTFETGLALAILPIIYLLPLTPVPRAKVIQFGDVGTYLLIAIGFGALAVALSLGRLYWWLEEPWIGVLLAVAVVTLTVAVVAELHRKTPMIDVRWLVGRENLQLAGVLLTFRLLIAEQSSVATSFYQVMGLQPDQTVPIYLVILAAAVVSGTICAFVMKPGREPALHIIALVLIAGGAYIDSQATNLTRPEQMYLSQAMIAAGGALFLPPSMAVGLKAAFAKGQSYIISFFVIFVGTQSMGGLLGSALFGTFVTWREKFHSNILSEHIVATNPYVAQRIGQLSAAYGKVLTDKTLLNAEGAVLLGQQVTREANVLAYNDAFRLIFVLAVGALVILLTHLAYIHRTRLFSRISVSPVSA